RTLPHNDGTRNRSGVLARKESISCARRRTSGWNRVRGDGRSEFPLRAALGRRFAATAGGLPGVFWTFWLGLIVNRLASFVIAFLSIYLVRERGFSAAEAGKVLALYGAGMIFAGPLGGLLADRIGRRTTMIGGLILGACAVGTLAFAREPALLALFTFFAAAAGGLYRPALSAAGGRPGAPPPRPPAPRRGYLRRNAPPSVCLSS